MDTTLGVGPKPARNDGAMIVRAALGMEKNVEQGNLQKKCSSMNSATLSWRLNRLNTALVGEFGVSLVSPTGFEPVLLP